LVLILEGEADGDIGVWDGEGVDWSLGGEVRRYGVLRVSGDSVNHVLWNLDGPGIQRWEIGQHGETTSQ